MNKETIHITTLPGSTLPTYANYNDAGADVYAAEDLQIRPLETVIIPLQFKVALPDHLEMQVRPRSGLSLKTTLRIPNSPGTVDAGYRDLVGVVAENTANPANLPYEMLYKKSLREDILKNHKLLYPTDPKAPFTTYKGEDYETPLVANTLPYLIVDKHNNPYGTMYIQKGMKIAQVVFHEVVHGQFLEVEDVTTIGTNRGGGYGSTGV